VADTIEHGDANLANPGPKVVMVESRDVLYSAIIVNMYASMYGMPEPYEIRYENEIKNVTRKSNNGT
jgi:hypothetical protein